MTMETPPRKGSFGRLRLPLTMRYLYPPSRNRLLLAGAALAVLAGLVLAVNMAFQGGQLISNGPLSSAHANLENNCSACHTSFASVTNEKCSVCHEKLTGGLGVYTFNAHYVYVSGDRTRAFVRGGEIPCAACHTEHEGRDRALTLVPDARCTTCHAFSFNAGHPEFEFAAESTPDDEHLAFTHIRHVERVLDAQDIENHELACLACHNPTADGRLFEPIAFDRHCASCHLGPWEQSAPLPIKAAGAPLIATRGSRAALALGVETLGMIRRRVGPGEEWVRSMSEALFEQDGDKVTKVGLEHRDRWIMHNLRLLRAALYPSGGLPALLRSSADVPPGQERELYEEAAATLQTYADGLRGRPEPYVQDELVEIDELLARLRTALASPDAAFNASRFRLRFPREDVTADQIAEIEEFADLVAEPCRQCHTLAQATIARVQQDQRVLRRARFNHRAHILQRDCLSCHNNIPFFEQFDTPGPVDPSIDNAAIQNLPRIAECQQCHTPSFASNRCLTCHDFHPDKSHRAQLSLD